MAAAPKRVRRSRRVAILHPADPGPPYLCIWASSLALRAGTEGMGSVENFDVCAYSQEPGPRRTWSVASNLVGRRELPKDCPHSLDYHGRRRKGGGTDSSIRVASPNLDCFPTALASLFIRSWNRDLLAS